MTELVGLKTICEITGRPRGTIDSWRHRGRLPTPDLVVDGRPLWHRRTVVAWHNGALTDGWEDLPASTV